MDCSTGLNRYLLSGPNLLNDVVGVLLRFRSGLVAYSGDVSKMFLMIKLHPADRPYHCFLWREDPQSPPAVYRFNFHVFGNTGSPFVAVFVVKAHSQINESAFPKALNPLNNST